MCVEKASKLGALEDIKLSFMSSMNVQSKVGVSPPSRLSIAKTLNVSAFVTEKPVGEGRE